MNQIKCILAVLIFVALTGCATRKLINETSAVTNSPTSLINARKCDDQFIIIYSAQSLIESSREVKFIEKASLFTLTRAKTEKTLVGENIDLEIAPFLERKPLNNPPPFPIGNCENIPIVKENCEKNDNAVVICGRSPAEFKIGITENTNERAWYSAKIDSTVAKEKKSFTRALLFPFAIVFDIAISPIYVVGGTLAMLYVGIVGHE